MTNRTALRPWAWPAVLAAAYAALGYWLSADGTVEMWLYRTGLTAVTFAPLLFVAIYTALGLRGPAKWWKNALGTALVQAALSLVPITAPLAIALWFYNGRLAPGWLAWIEVSGPVVSAFAWLRLCALWVLLRRAPKLAGAESGGDDE